MEGQQNAPLGAILRLRAPQPRWGAATPEAGERSVRRNPKTPRCERFQGSKCRSGLVSRARMGLPRGYTVPRQKDAGSPGAGRLRSPRRAAEGARPAPGGPAQLLRGLRGRGRLCLVLSIPRGEPYAGPGKKLSVSREDAHIRRNPLGDLVRVSAVTFVCSHSRAKQQCTWP